MAYKILFFIYIKRRYFINHLAITVFSSLAISSSSSESFSEVSSSSFSNVSSFSSNVSKATSLSIISETSLILSLLFELLQNDYVRLSDDQNLVTKL